MKNVAIMGMGAVGSAIADYLYKTYRDNFYVVASGERKERLMLKGVKVNDTLIYPHIIDNNSVNIDLLILTVKNYSLEIAMRELEGIISEKTIILPLLNGVTATDRLKKYFPNNKVLYGIILRTDANRIGREVTYSTTGEIQIGFEDSSKNADDLLEVKRFLAHSGLNVNIYDDIIKMIWRKWMINVGANQVSVEAHAEFKYYGLVPEIVELMKLSMDEILRVAEKEHINLTLKDRDEVIDILINYPPYKKTSMLQDIEANRPTEIDYFAGTVVELSEKHGLEAPINKTLYLAIKARERVYMIKNRDNNV